MRPSSRWPAALLLLGAGCAELKASQVTPGALTGETFTAGRAGAAAYGPSAAFTCRASDVVQWLVKEVPATSAQDGQLCAVAEALLGWTSEEPPGAAVLDHLAWTYGLPSPPRLKVMVAKLETEEPEQLAAAFKDALAQHAKTSPKPRWGAAVQRLRKGSTRVAVVMQDAVVDLAAVPRSLAAGASARVKGRLNTAPELPAVVWSDEKGELHRAPASTTQDFDVEVSCRTKGRLLAEVQGDRGTRAALPIACGEPLPGSVSLAGDGPDAVKKVFEEVNAERTAAGLPALEWEPQVAAAAAAAAEALSAASGAVADPAPFLQAANVAAALVVENPGQALGVREAHRAFSLSPQLRGNYMNPSVTHGGVGVANGPELQGRKTVFVVELFIKRLAKVDVAKVGAELAQKIADQRAAAKAAALGKDPALEKAAQAYADALAASKGTLTDEKANAFLSPLYKSWASLNVMSGARADPLSIADEASVTGKGSHLGMGVAQGDHGSLGPNTVYVVVLIGTKR